MARLLKLSNHLLGIKMGDHLGSKHFVFFRFGYDWQNIRQIKQILLISLSFGKTQMTMPIV